MLAALPWHAAQQPETARQYNDSFVYVLVLRERDKNSNYGSKVTTTVSKLVLLVQNAWQ